MNKSTTDTPRTDSWECFSDPSYYDMARLRRTDGPKDFNTGYHLNNLREAVEVRDILNELERRAEKAEAEVASLKDELAKGVKVLSTIVTALENAVPWIRTTLNRD